MDNNLNKGYIDLLFNKFYKDFQQFIFSNNILITASGFTIGIATKTLIENSLNLIAPFFAFISTLYIKFDKKYLGIFSNNKTLSLIIYTIVSFISNILYWIITIIFTFILLEYLLNNHIFGLKSTVKENDEKDFIISKMSAKKEGIIPDDKELKKIKLKELNDEIVGDKIIKQKEKDKIKNVVNNMNDKNYASVNNFTNYML